MNKETWTSKVSLLQKTFGENKYNDARVSIIWNDVKDLSDYWLKRIVDQAVKNYKDIQWGEEISKERERVWDNQKKEPFAPKQWNNSHSIFSKEEIAQHFQVMRDAATGKIAPQQARQYASVLREALKTSGIEPIA